MSGEEEHEETDTGLATPGGKLRLYVEAALGPGLSLALLAAQEHYLLRVMRARDGDRARLFNGRDGEWRARITLTGKRRLTLECEAPSAPQREVPDVWLAFAPIKRIPADYVAQKATELGVRALQPVITRRTVARRVNLDRLAANAIEAAEQSGRVSVPDIWPPAALDALLDRWPAERRLVFCDEAGEAAPIAAALSAVRGPCGILTGPEGGFAPEERAAIRARPFALPVTLGPRILRADTAALAALAIWQSLCGDWR